MKLFYKIAIPIFVGLVLVIVIVAFFSRHLIEKSLLQEAFLRNYEAVLKYSPKHLRAEHFRRPLTPSDEKRMKEFYEELLNPSVVRLTVWNRDRVILFSDLRSLVGVSSPNHRDLNRLFAQEKPFYIMRKEDTHFPLQSVVGEFLDIYIPVRLAGQVVGAVQIHAVTSALLLPVERQIRYTTILLVAAGLLVLVLVLNLTRNLMAERDMQAVTARQTSQLYEEIKIQAAELERANKVKSEFLSVMSHELKTPLSTVLGYVESMQDGLMGDLNPEQDRALRMMHSKSDELLNMINGILRATHLETMSMAMETDEVDLGLFLGELRLSYTSFSDKRLDIKWDYSDDLPMITTDPEKLKQIMKNLIDNAIKFTPRGTVTVSAGYLADSEEVVFRVADTGVGISKESQCLIFEMFTQVDGSRARIHGGVGLGLYIVKKLTALLGGKIRVGSEPGRGSTFTLSLPCKGNWSYGLPDNHPSR